MTHIMVDIETLGTKPGCVILSIGACVFDPDTTEIGETFYVNIDRTRMQDMGFDVDPRTVDWWGEQSQEAQDALLVDCKYPTDAMQAFVQWFKEMGGTYIWSHGATFDVVLIENVLDCMHISPPWKFWDVRDTRTLYDVAAVEVDRSSGTHHNALDDARQQALAVQAAMQKLRGATS